MREVYLAAAAEHPRGNLWRQNSCDLALDLCDSLISQPVQGFFVASPAAARLDGQANYATIFADRLGLPPNCVAQQFDNGDIAGATALSSAYAFIKAGLLDSALVLGVAKITDWEDKKRYKLMDELIDTDIEKQLGLDYLSLSGLLAANYLNRHHISASLFHHLVAKNHANACRGSASYLAYPALAEELARDLKTAFPLGRSDIAPLLDGAVALILADATQARKRTKKPVRLTAMGTGMDVTAIADRANICSLAAVEQAYSAVSQQDSQDFFLIEIQNSSSILEVLAMEALGLIKPAMAEAYYKNGGGLSTQTPVINAQGGQQGLGNLFGLAAIEHGVTAFRQLRQEAGDYQLPAAQQSNNRVLSVSMSGLATQCYCFIYEKIGKITPN